MAPRKETSGGKGRKKKDDTLTAKERSDAVVTKLKARYPGKIFRGHEYTAPWLLKLKDCKDCKDCINVYVDYELDEAKAAHALSLHNYHRKGTEAALYQQRVLPRRSQNE